MSLKDELLALQDADGNLSPSAVLEFARDNPESECHKRYEAAGLWDDAKAAEAARMGFARHLIQRYRVKITGNDGAPRHVRAMVSTTESRGNGHGSYSLRSRVMSDEERRHQMQRDCSREIRSLAKRYGDVLSADDLSVLTVMAARTEAGFEVAYEPSQLAAAPA